MDNAPASAYITREEHKEFARRLDAEEERQNQRLKLLEENVQEMQKTNVSLERLTLSVEIMAKELSKQGERLENLESVPAKDWNTLKAGIIGAIAAAIGGGLVTLLASSLLQ